MKRLLIFGICVLVCWGCEDERQPQKVPVITNLTITEITESAAFCTFTIEPVGATRQAGVLFGTFETFFSDASESSTTRIADGNIWLTLSPLDMDTEYFYKAYITDRHNSFIYSDVGQFRTIPLLMDVSLTTIAASYAAGNYGFTIMSNGSWSISSNQNWCNVQPIAGNGNREITVSVTGNTTGTPRTATLTITAGNKSQQVMVEQGIDNTILDVSKTKLDVSYMPGQHASFNITSNANWTISSNEAWCTVQPTSGNGNGVIAVSVNENTTVKPRTATLTVKAGSKSQQVMVEQGVANSILSVSKTELYVSYMAGQHASFIITSNVAWSITSNAEWCTVLPASGKGNWVIAVSVAANTTGTPRTATLTVTGGGKSQQVMVEQGIDDTTLNVSVSTINAPYIAREHSFIITSNTNWSIGSNQGWCTVQPTSGNVNSFIYVTVSENDTGTPRNATLTVTAGRKSEQVMVIQDNKGANVQ